MKTLASTKSLVLRYTPKDAIPTVGLRYLNIPLHPLRPKIAHMYEHRDRNTLWWRVSVHPLMQFRRVVRSWSARRARFAFKQALKERGFDGEGRKILDNGQGTDTTTVGTSESLTGSCEIIVREQCIKEEYPQIQEEMSSLVDTLLQNSQQPSSKQTQRKRQEPKQQASR